MSIKSPTNNSTVNENSTVNKINPECLNLFDDGRLIVGSNVKTINNNSEIVYMDFHHKNSFKFKSGGLENKRKLSFLFPEKNSMNLEILRRINDYIDIVIDFTKATNLTVIGNSAFYNCTCIKGKLKLPESLTKIDGSAFYGCTGITELKLPNSLITIGISAFYGCTGITCELKLPESLNKIGAYAFSICTGITGELKLPESLTEIGIHTFSRCTNITNLKLPNSLTKIGMNAFYHCTGITGELKLPESLTEIDLNAFYGCTGITGELKLPNSLITLGENAFYECTGIKELKLPESLIRIGANAFRGCSGITKLKLSINLLLNVLSSDEFVATNIKIVSITDGKMLPLSIKKKPDSIKQKLVKITGNNNWNTLGTSYERFKGKFNKNNSNNNNSNNYLIIEFMSKVPSLQNKASEKISPENREKLSNHQKKNVDYIKYYVIDLSKSTNQKGGSTKRFVTRKRYNRNSKKTLRKNSSKYKSKKTRYVRTKIKRK